MGWIGVLVPPPQQPFQAVAAAVDPAIPTIDTSIALAVRDGRRDASVYFKTTWSQGWQLQPHVYCDEIHHRIGGQIGSATLRYQAGRMLRRGETTFDDYSKLSGPRLWVKIEFTTDKGVSPYKWYGISVYRETKPLGSDTYDQAIVCRDLKWILTRQQINAAYVKQGGISKRIERSPTFNENTGGARGSYSSRANRTLSVGPQGVYLFDQTLESASLWRASDIVRYLTAYFQPMTANAPRILPDSSLDLMDWFTPTIDCTSRTLFEVFNQLIEPTRGATWSLVMDEAIPQIILKVHSFANDNITLAGDETLGKNTNQKSLNVNTQRDAGVVFTEDQQREYEQVVVRGAKRTATVTLGMDDGRLRPAWTTQDELAYKRGNPTVDVDANFEEELMQHDNARNATLKRVYTTYRVISDWDGTVTNSDQAVFDEPACPELNENAVPQSTVSQFWQPGLRWLPTLPLLEDVDYSDYNSIPPSADPVPKFLRPFVTFEFTIQGVTIREFGHKLQSMAYTESLGDGGVELTTHLSLLDGLNVRVQPTGMPHLIAEGSFDPVSQAQTAFSEQYPQVDYRTMKLTACIEWDEYCESRYPKNSAITVGHHDTISRLFVYIGERARQDWIAQGTEVGIVDGDPVVPKSDTFPVGFFVRDDREYLDRTARTIYEWFATPRQAITLTLHGQLNAQFELGDMISSIDSESVNSVVTGITWDFLQGTTRLSAEFADLDFAGVLS